MGSQRALQMAEGHEVWFTLVKLSAPSSNFLWMLDEEAVSLPGAQKPFVKDKSMQGFLRTWTRL